MSIETIEYMGLPGCIRISNGSVDVIATTAVGPRILYYGPTGGKNLLAHFPASSVETALGTWKPYGGHRLWVWPELFPATYAPDNEAIDHVVESELSVTLRQPTDSAAMEKEIRITLEASDSKVKLDQKVTSHALWPVDIAAWAITVVECGTAIVPRVPFRSHDEYVTVTQPLAMCAFTDLQDPRFTLGLRYVMLRADPTRANSQKFGLRNKQEWCAHLVDDSLFVKRFAHEERAAYPDYGVNNEVYVEGSYMEVELLGPHRVVDPGDSLTLTEEWHLFEGVGAQDALQDEERLHAAIAPKIQSLF
ncbi:MAG: hypothetical protein HIU93_04285 [Acidobacteria bacterium]|nr:hypothetical protein [Acidobacteriota bacterium]MBW4044771.1 hypothetical protein [Acidobacteriota bacterium]